MKRWMLLALAVLALGCDDGRQAMVKANRAYLDGQTERALELYEKASQHSSVEVSALVSWGRILVEKGQNEQALERLDQALAIEPFNGLAYYYRAQARHSLGLEGALQDLDRALKIQPSMGEAWQTLALWQYQDGEREKALASIEVALGDPSVRKSASLHKARWALELGDPGKARQALERLVGWYPYSWEGHLALAELYLDLSRPDLARAYLDRAARWADPESSAQVEALQKRMTQF